jgi:uncharacterized integral membrane protein
MIKKNVFKSVRAKLFITLCVVILMIIFFFIVINNTVLETLRFPAAADSFNGGVCIVETCLPVLFTL